MSTQALLVLTTCTSTDEARRLAQTLVERRLATCVNTVQEIASTYRWQGRIEQARECLLLIKSTRERYAALEEAIRDLSSYELPEVLALPVEGGSAAYLSWLVAGVSRDNDGA